MDFWQANIRKLNGFSNKPVLPSIIVCEIVAGDASAVGHYVAKFSDKHETMMSHPFSAFEQEQSSTYREGLVVQDLYTKSHSPIVNFKRQQELHVTNNQGVGAVFTKGSPHAPLQSMAVRVYMAANRLDIKCTLFGSPGMIL